MSAGLCALCGRKAEWRGRTGKCAPCLAIPATMVQLTTPADVLASAPPAVRHDSRQGSLNGAAAASFKATSQKAHLLRTWAANPQGLTDEEAAMRTSEVNPRSCYWKRSGELRELGLIRFTGATRPGTMGVEREVSVITDEGRAMVARLGSSERNTA